MSHIDLFGHRLATSKRGAPLPPGLRKLVRAPGIVCRLTSSFDGMIDGSRSCDDVVTGDWVCERVLSGKAYTRSCYVTHRLGAPVVRLFDACYSLDIDDGEVARRKAVWESLPLMSRPALPLPLLCSGGDTWVRTSGSLRQVIEGQSGLVTGEVDGVTFDELCEDLRGLDLEGVQRWAAARGWLTLAHLRDDKPDHVDQHGAARTAAGYL